MPVLDIIHRIARGIEMDKLLEARYRTGVDSREQPLYTIREAAEYLGVGQPTLQTWFFGRSYPTKDNPKKLWLPVFSPADPELRLLSFFNLAEAHILAATRYQHKVPFWAVREAIAKLVEQTSPAHPLLSEEFFTNGALLFVRRIEEYVNVSSHQLSLDIMKSFLVRVVKTREGNPFEDDQPYKVYPLRPDEPDDKIISIMAGISGSRPIIDGTRIPALAIWRRVQAGEREEFIAEDYEIEQFKVRRAIEYVEKRRRAA
jgi:uncharacterized protein (DUF433 family)